MQISHDNMGGQYTQEQLTLDILYALSVDLLGCRELSGMEETKPTVAGGLTSSPQTLVASVTVCLCNDYKVQL